MRCAHRLGRGLLWRVRRLPRVGAARCPCTRAGSATRSGSGARTGAGQGVADPPRGRAADQRRRPATGSRRAGCASTCANGRAADPERATSRRIDRATTRRAATCRTSAGPTPADGATTRGTTARRQAAVRTAARRGATGRTTAAAARTSGGAVGEQPGPCPAGGRGTPDHQAAGARHPAAAAGRRDLWAVRRRQQAGPEVLSPVRARPRRRARREDLVVAATLRTPSQGGSRGRCPSPPDAPVRQVAAQVAAPAPHLAGRARPHRRRRLLRAWLRPRRS